MLWSIIPIDHNLCQIMCEFSWWEQFILRTDLNDLVFKHQHSPSEPFLLCKNLAQERDASKHFCFCLRLVLEHVYLVISLKSINLLISLATEDRVKRESRFSIYRENDSLAGFNNLLQELSSGTPGLQSPTKFLLLLFLLFFWFFSTLKKDTVQEAILRKGKD